MKTNPEEPGWQGRVKALTSSQTSRTAATPGSSSGSMPPPGTIHRSGWRLLLTSSTCGEQRQLMGHPRDCLCASHIPRHHPPKAGPCHCSLLPRPHPRLQWHRGAPTLCVTSATASPCSDALQEKLSLHTKTLISTGHSITHSVGALQSPQSLGYTPGNNTNAQMLLSTSTLCRSTLI